jgi:hypothetical protein
MHSMAGLTGVGIHDGHSQPPASLHLHNHPNSHRQPPPSLNHHLHNKASSTHSINMHEQQNKCLGKSQQSRCEKFMQKFKSFWECSKPCGILTLILGVLSIIASVSCFLIVYGTNYCQDTDIEESLQKCSTPIIRLFAIVFLVISIFILFIGTVIVIYSKRDRNATIIVTSSPHKNGYAISTQKDNAKEGHQAKADSKHLLSNEQFHNKPSSKPKHDTSPFSSTQNLNKNIIPFIDSDI